jgi:hypothetical protein
MKTTALALAGLLTMAGYSHAQPPAAGASPSEESQAYSEPKSRDCKKEVKKLCGRRPKGELQSCLKDGVDLKKFSDSCTSEITKAKAQKPES